MNEVLKNYLKKTGDSVSEFVNNNIDSFLEPRELRDASLLYFNRGGKRLRPGLVCLAAGLFGGENAETAALPCAAGVELFHNWTLIHDDIIDNDDVRRGGSSVHVAVAALFRDCGEKSREYGRDVAILAGDALHSMSIRLMTKLVENGVSSEIALKIISLCEGEYVNRLLCGETLDTRSGLFSGNVISEGINEDESLNIMLGKTGALFALCAVSGAMIGLGISDEKDDRITALKCFAENCGIAFQLKDDILGVTSDEKTLGKPIGGDIREGKATLILAEAIRNASPSDREFFERVVGNRQATTSEVERALGLLQELGGVDYAARLAADSIDRALKSLEVLPHNTYSELLCMWAESMSARKL